MICGMIRSPLKWEGWPKAQELILRSVERSDDSMADVESRLAKNRAQLWVAIDDPGVMLAGVTQLMDLKKGRQCFIWHLGGQWDDYAWRLFREVEQWARREGCTDIEGNMRPGFERLLPDWRKTSIVMRKALEG